MNAPTITTRDAHTFQIPVLGTGYTVDTPLKVARFGISSVISLVDDTIIEQVREHHCREHGLEYTEITGSDEDSRARRIRAYLDMLDSLISIQMEEMRQQAFGLDSELDRCFEMLPDCELRQQYFRMLEMPAGSERDEQEAMLRDSLEPGSIDVNIMTKLDRQRWENGAPVDAWYSDATTALRGYADSTVSSTIIFSAGMNPRLFAAIADYPDFHADANGQIKKKICLKVSDYRSAWLQGMQLARKGIWVSEYRVESGLNCGGHAFAAKGSLIGPILDEFMQRRDELHEKLYEVYAASCEKLGRAIATVKIAITVQGGVGTADEHRLLKDYFKVEKVGWGTPFMLVPEAVNLDPEHMEMLCQADGDDVFLSEASPLGVPFWNLRGSGSERAREQRIANGRPGVACAKKFLAFDTEFSQEPICPAAMNYQKKKLAQLDARDISTDLRERLRKSILAKACLCVDLGATVTKVLGIEPKGTAAITPGPNIVNFNRIVSLKEMVQHIYGRVQLIVKNDRAHMFIRELELYIEHVGRELSDVALGALEKGEKYFEEVGRNLHSGVEYYRGIAGKLLAHEKALYLERLESLKQVLNRLLPQV